MGRFFTSTQIYNPKQLDQTTIIDLFCNGMKELGYMPCTSSDGDISYIMRFVDGSKWVTITSDAYGQGNQYAQTDTGEIAKMLKAICINTTVIDSDCAILNLYDESGKKKDSLIMGRADDYLGNDISDPIESEWSPLLEDNHTWEQLLEVQKANYVFIEEGLLKIAKILEIAPCNITFSVENIRENEDKTVILDFKKKSSMNIKTKTGNKPKITVNLNAAFKQIVGEALAPYGFQIIKGRHPYLVRVINNEILHIITFCPENPEYPEDKAIAIMGGVATIYRKRIALDVSPKLNRGWLSYMQRFYVLLTKDTDIGNAQKLYKTCYYSQNSESLTEALKEAAKRIQAYMLPVLDRVQDIDSCLAYCQDFLIPCNPQKCAKICSYYPDEDEAFLYFLSKKTQEEKPEFLSKFLQNPEFRKWVMSEMERRKLDNLKILNTFDLI